MNRPVETYSETIQRCNDILAAVGFASSLFLQSANWQDALENALQQLGQATRANRAYFFENHLRDDGDVLTSQLAEWAAPGIQPQIDNEALQNLSYQELGLLRWVDVMNDRKPIHGLISSFPKAEQAILESQDIQSLIAMPVFSQGQLVGFLGFDDCESLREWSRAEFDALFAAAVALGAAIDRQHLEHQIHFSQKMEAIGRLASGIAHDFNNSLQAIVGLTQVAKLKIKGQDSVQGNLDGVLLATDRAHGLTRQLLSFSRKQASHQKNVNLGQVCESVVTMAKPVLDGRAEISVSTASPPPVVFVDESLVSQVILNMCLNARDAVPSGGVIQVRCGRELLSKKRLDLYPEIEPGEFAVVEVRDNGCGMSPEVQDRIFEPFFTTKAVGEGTGLGLSVAYGTVQQFGGFIEVTSELGDGTEFRVYIPIATDQEILTSAKMSVADGGGEMILLVDDEEIVRESFKELLMIAGYRVLTASNGVEALQQYQVHSDEISLVVSDTVMPEMDGVAMVDSILKTNEHAKIILLSGYSLSPPSFIKNHDNFLMLQKPIGGPTLCQAMRRLLD
ncbi:ATP-binding protein [Stieleria marina]|uniref:histidine kinase n=1 Tax=Stieleria marina TaxID=1930275 RepID=A0A517NQ82_9BACT|nr:Blue-light-activated protein [Planctomycetes bacterium K23_9]